MPIASAFAPGGLVSHSSRPFHAESIYRALRADVGQAFAEGGVADAALYARAQALGIARYTIDRLANQVDPLLATELLGPQETAHKITPPATATLIERRATLAAATKAARGDQGSNLSDALAAALGSRFVALRNTTSAEAIPFPSSPGSVGVFTRVPNGIRRIYKLAAAISTIGTPVFAPYTDLAGAFPARQMLPNDRIGIIDRNVARIESMNVADVTATGPAFRATFTKPHDAGTPVVVYRWPYWCSTKRESLVILTAAAAVDPESRRIATRVMARMATGVSVWSIVAATGAHTAGPFHADTSPLDVTPIGTVSF